MSWKLKNSKNLDELYISQLEKYNPDLVYQVDDIISGLKKLNKELPSQNIVIMRSNNSNKGFVCFNGENCKKLEGEFDRIIQTYKHRYDGVDSFFNNYRK